MGLGKIFAGIVMAGASVLGAGGEADANEIIDLNDGLVSYYSFEGNVNDTEGTNHGVNHGADYVDGKIGKGLSFNGVNDYVNVGSDLSLNFVGAPMTVSAWVNTTRASTQIILGSRGIHGYNVFLDNFKAGFGESHVSSIDSTDSITANNWHHLGVVYKTNDEVRFYIDGLLDSGNPQVYSPTFTIGNQYNIGLRDGTLYPFSGTIDEVGVWNRALTAGEVNQIWERDNGKAIPEPTGLVLLAGGASVLASRRKRKQEKSSR